MPSQEPPSSAHLLDVTKEADEAKNDAEALGPPPPRRVARRNIFRWPRRHTRSAVRPPAGVVAAPRRQTLVIAADHQPHTGPWIAAMLGLWTFGNSTSLEVTPTTM